MKSKRRMKGKRLGWMASSVPVTTTSGTLYRYSTFYRGRRYILGLSRLIPDGNTYTARLRLYRRYLSSLEYVLVGEASIMSDNSFAHVRKTAMIWAEELMPHELEALADVGEDALKRRKR